MAGARGEQRRDLLVRSAAALLLRHGPESVTARAVAADAGVSLGAVTYYFEDLPALKGAAAARLVERHLATAREVVDDVSPRMTARQVAESLARVLLGPYADQGPEGVRALYARALDAAAGTTLAAQVAAWDEQLAKTVRELLLRAGRDPSRSRALLACADGAALAAVLSRAPDPLRRITDGVADVLDLIAPCE